LGGLWVAFGVCPTHADGNPGLQGAQSQGGPGAAGGNPDDAHGAGGGGGGGGGYFGGGGGGGGSWCSAGFAGSGGGGGGGSSFVDLSVTDSSITEAVHSGDGSVSFSFVDAAGPVDAPQIVPAPHRAGWVTAPIAKVDWNWTDVGAGVDPSSCTQVSQTTAEGEVDVSALCSDTAGNESEDSVVIHHDASRPRIKLGSPTHHRYLLGAVVRAKYRCTDTGSGIAQCRAPVASGGRIRTGTLGVHRFTVRAKDRVGHTTRRTVTYRVVRHG
jgi:hypothetical protein